jgi:hypothetical protein
MFDEVKDDSWSAGVSVELRRICWATALLRNTGLSIGGEDGRSTWAAGLGGLVWELWSSVSDGIGDGVSSGVNSLFVSDWGLEWFTLEGRSMDGWMSSTGSSACGCGWRYRRGVAATSTASGISENESS